MPTLPAPTVQVPHARLLAMLLALRAAERSLVGTLAARGYEPSAGRWSPEVCAEVSTLAMVRHALAAEG